MTHFEVKQVGLLLSGGCGTIQLLTSTFITDTGREEMRAMLVPNCLCNEAVFSRSDLQICYLFLGHLKNTDFDGFHNFPLVVSTLV